MFNQSRRKLLKTLAYGSALSVGGLSTAAIAASSTKAVPSSEMQEVTLFNQSDKSIALNATQPVDFQEVNGWAVLNINKAEKHTHQSINLAAGERATYMVDTHLASKLESTGNYIVITNEFDTLNNMIPVSTVEVA